MSLTHVIKQGDTEPVLRVKMTNADGTALVLAAGDVVTFRMTPQIPELRADISSTATINDLPTGDVEWVPLAADTAVPGLYNAEFHVARLAGDQLTFPTDGYIVVTVEHKATA